MYETLQELIKYMKTNAGFKNHTAHKPLFYKCVWPFIRQDKFHQTLDKWDLMKQKIQQRIMVKMEPTA